MSTTSRGKKNRDNKVLVVEVVAGRNLVAIGENDRGSDPYVIVVVGKEKCKTKVLRETRDPVWDIGSMCERFEFKSKSWNGKEKSDVILKCMDWDRFKADDRMGMLSIPIKTIEEQKQIDQWFTLRPQKAGDFVTGELHVRLMLTDIANEFQPSELWKAVKRGDDDLVKQLLEKKNHDMNEKDSNSETLLHLASKNAKSDSSIVVQLLNANISVSACDNEGNTPLHTFCRHFAYPSDILAKLIEKGADVNAQNKHGETPLHHVVFNPSIKLLMAELLLQAKANPNIVATNRDSPLHYSIQIGRTDLVKLLIAYGADCNLAGSKGKIPVALAKQIGLTSLADIIQDSLHVQHFLKRLNLEHLIYTFLDQEIYLYHLGDIPDTSLAKYVKNIEEREKIVSSAKDIKILERKETFLRKQESEFKKREELRKKESRMRNMITNTLPKSNLEWEIDLSDLEFIQSLGHGASGAVYRGSFKSSIPVAIKVLKASGTDPENEAQEFIREFSVALKVQSPHIVHFYGATLKNKLCMVMEFCEKGSLYNLLKDPDFYLDWDRTFSMLEETVKGILALHNYQPPILHRDLKTLNVLVTSDYKCKVCDFGLSRFESASNAETLLKCRGTYAYIAPEVYSQKGYFKQSDVYSLSIMMWEFVNRVATGEYLRPYQEVKIEFTILMLVHTKQKRPTIPDAAPKSFADLITKCWQPDYNIRPDAQGLLKELECIKMEYLQNKEAWEAVCKNKKPPEEIRPKIRRRGGGSLSQATIPVINGTQGTHL